MMLRPADRAPRLGVRFAGALLPALALCACGSSSDSGPGGVSKGEAGALDEIAETLDKQQIPESAIPPVDLPAGQQEETAPPQESGEPSPAPAAQGE